MSTSDVIINIVPNKDEVANNNVVVTCQRTGAYKTVDNTANKKPETVRAIELDYTDRFSKKRPSFGIVPTVAALPTTTTTTTTTTTPAPDCANSISSVRMMGWYAGDRILSPIGYAPYGRETYIYGDEAVRYETGVWLYTNTGAEIVRAYSDAEWPWLVDWPSPYAAEKICDPANITTTTTTTTTPPPNPFLYGLDVVGNIWEVDIVNKSFAIIYNNPLRTNEYYNALSYDPNRDQIFYMYPANTTLVAATCLDQANKPNFLFSTSIQNINNVPQGAAYYNNSLWFFKGNDSNVLQKWNLNYSRTSPILNNPAFIEFTLQDVDLSTVSDVAIDANTGILYGITYGGIGGLFFSINLNSPSNSFTIIREFDGSDLGFTDTNGFSTPQLAFNTNYSTLYCHVYENGAWFTIDKTNGSLTSLNFTSTFSERIGKRGLIDIAGARPLSRILSNTTPSPWEITVETTSINQDFSISLIGTAVDMIIDWGDGVVQRYTTQMGSKTHSYATAGTYTIKIRGSLGTNGRILLGTTAQNRPRIKSVGVVPIISGLANFKQTFQGCTGLTSVPENLFLNYPDLSTNVFDSTFSGCSGLTTIPENLFKNQTKLGKGDFYATFNNCTGLTTIPANLFRYNTSVGSASFSYTFAGCTSLATIPADIFRYNTGVDSLSFVGVFDKVTIPTSTYNDILVSLNTYLGSKTGIKFNAGNSKSSGSGTTAREALVSKGWTILDGSDLVLHLDSQNSNSYAGSGIVWNDLSGFNNSAKLINGAYYDGQHMIFDGSNDYAEVLNSAYINDCLNSDFTFDMWVYMYFPQISPFGKIISKGGYFAPGFNGVSLNMRNNVIYGRWQYKASNGSVSTLIETSLASNAWTNLVYTRANGLLSVYKNGQFVSSINNTYDLRSNYNLRIGSNYQPDNQSKQKVAVLKQYRTSLTSSEILANYNALSSRFV